MFYDPDEGYQDFTLNILGSIRERQLVSVWGPMTQQTLPSDDLHDGTAGKLCEAPAKEAGGAIRERNTCQVVRRCFGLTACAVGHGA